MSNFNLLTEYFIQIIKIYFQQKLCFMIIYNKRLILLIKKYFPKKDYIKLLYKVHQRNGVFILFTDF